MWKLCAQNRYERLDITSTIVFKLDRTVGGPLQKNILDQQFSRVSPLQPHNPCNIQMDEIVVTVGFSPYANGKYKAMSFCKYISIR